MRWGVLGYRKSVTRWRYWKVIRWVGAALRKEKELDIRKKEKKKVRKKRVWVSVSLSPPVSAVAHLHFEQSLPRIGLRRMSQVTNSFIIVLCWRSRIKIKSQHSYDAFSQKTNRWWRREFKRNCNTDAVRIILSRSTRTDDVLELGRVLRSFLPSAVLLPAFLPTHPVKLSQYRGSHVPVLWKNALWKIERVE